MGIKLKIGKHEIDLVRGSSVPREGDSLAITLKGEKKEKTYTVYLIEHTFDFNQAVTLGSTLITLKEVKTSGA